MEFISEDILNSSFLTALLGAVIGGLFSFGATTLSHRHQRILMSEQESKKLRDYLGAIHSELSVLYDRYVDMLDEAILNNNPDLRLRFSVPEGIFSVYTSNLDKIGNVEVALREKIINCYKSGAALVDVLMMNNYVLNEYEENERLEKIYSDPTQKSYFRNIKTGRAEELKNQKKLQLEPIYKSFKQNIDELIPLLELHKTKQ